MKTDLETLLTELYVQIEDVVLPKLGWSRDHRPGRKPRLTDGELLCLAAAQHLQGIASERHWLRVVRKRLPDLFPYLPGQSGYSKRLRSLGSLIAAVLDELVRDVPSFYDSLRLLDSTPLPCGTSRQTVTRSRLRGYADYGYCAAHSRRFWGMRLYLLTTAEGLPIRWCLATPKLGEREVAEALLADEEVLLQGSLILADKGFAGRRFEGFVRDDPGASLLRPDRKNEPKRFGSLGGMRQWVESVIDTLKGQLSLEEHGGRTIEGVYARVASRLLALTAAIWFNWRIAAPAKRSLIAFDH